MMPDLPGWDSIPAVTRYHSWAEIAGIAFVAFLVLAEILAYQYGHRRDDLLDKQQIAADKRHEEEMGRLHLEAAKANANAEATRERANQLEVTLERERALRIRLQRQSADRHIDDEQQAILSRVLFAGPPDIPVSMTLLGDKEPAIFGRELAIALQKAGAKVAAGGANTFVPQPVGVIVGVNERDPRSVTIFQALKQAGIGVFASLAPIDAPAVRITVGIKPNPQ